MPSGPAKLTPGVAPSPPCLAEVTHQEQWTRELAAWRAVAGEHDRMMRSWRKAWVRGRADGGQGLAGRLPSWNLSHSAFWNPQPLSSRQIPGERQHGGAGRGGMGWRGSLSRRLKLGKGARRAAGLGWAPPEQEGCAPRSQVTAEPQGAPSQHRGAAGQASPTPESWPQPSGQPAGQGGTGGRPRSSTAGLQTSRLQWPPQTSPVANKAEHC